MKSSSIARFTPATIATCEAVRWCLIAACRQLPPGRSTNTTAGASPMASRSRAARRPLSHPSLLIGTSWPASPVIWRTASTRAAASAACETTTPLRPLFIIFGEILPELALLRHPLDQALVQPLGRIHPVPAQQIIQRHHFGDH